MKNIILLLVMLMAVIIAGCDSVDPEKGYSSASLFDDRIETVAVDMFESDSFRRGVEFELTQALVERIGVNTPYKICQNKREADSVIYGRILNVDERVMAHQRKLDRPLQEQIVVVAEVTWKDLRSGKLILDRRYFRFSADYSSLQNDSQDAAVREAINDMAENIVEAMETGW